MSGEWGLITHSICARPFMREQQFCGQAVFPCPAMKNIASKIETTRPFSGTQYDA
ncbi:hypothetical protein [Paenirhodobacter populi]|uniref:hypothetical protein n=1 Tax=Paenirhodobacter populi TaxID=2306993 RepID=UPI0013E380C7|nr:hypothetical protein [Sinirhodobacter populi]